MQTTASRILTTHNGSLPLPDDLVDLLWSREQGTAIDDARVACVGPVAYRGQTRLQRDLADVTEAVAGGDPAGVFLSSASPGVIALFHPNHHYPSHEAYIWALAGAMREEYEAIHRAGFLLQIDCPDLAAGYHVGAGVMGTDEFRRVATVHISALNHARAAIPPERMRLYLCWGNMEGKGVGTAQSATCATT
ncbi:MAG: 5-methyltetrahydropteroyltriglutamate--homocysteine methyltransferase [Thermomicrobiales bacterium]|nr:5-methyltetrahydropteroyltriglutamate--homocysteine methyltransferase [Thermomicrobiales bacterium]